MSLQFWLNFFLAMVALAIALLFVNRSKFHFIQRLRASRLRNKITPKMKAIVSLISGILREDQADLFPLFKLRADLEGLVLKADSLFDVERLALIDFLKVLSIRIGEYDSGQLSSENINELKMSGERVIIELTELA